MPKPMRASQETGGGCHLLYKDQFSAAGPGKTVALALPCKNYSLQVRGGDGKWDVRLELGLDGLGWDEVVVSKKVDGGMVFVADRPALFLRVNVKAVGDPVTVLVLATV